MINQLKAKTVRFLRWSEQYTKTDMVYLAKGGFWTWLGKGTQIITGTAMAIAFANLLPKEVYGNYKYILSMAAIFGAFTLNGLNASITRSVSRGFEGSLKAGAKAMLKWSGFVFLGALTAAIYYFFQGNNLLAGGMLLIAIFQPLIKVGELYSAHLFGKKLFQVQGVYLMIWELVQAALIVGALFFTENAFILVATLFLLNLTFVSIYFWRTLKKHVQNEKTENGMLSWAKHLSIMQVLSTAAKHADKALIFQMLGAVPTAIYAFAILPTEKLDSLFRSIQQIILPKIANKPFKKLQETVTHKIGIALLATVIFTTILILVLPTIFSLLFPEYMDSVIYAQWLAAGLIFVPEVLFSQALVAHIQKRALYIINISSNILKLILLIILIPFYGIWGAVYAFIGFYAFHFFAKAFFFYFASPVDSTGSGSTQ